MGITMGIIFTRNESQKGREWRGSFYGRECRRARHVLYRLGAEAAGGSCDHTTCTLCAVNYLEPNILVEHRTSARAVSARTTSNSKLVDIRFNIIKQ